MPFYPEVTANSFLRCEFPGTTKRPAFPPRVGSRTSRCVRRRSNVPIAIFARRSSTASITFAPWGSGVSQPGDFLNQLWTTRPLPDRKWVFCFPPHKAAFGSRVPVTRFSLPDSVSGFTAEPRSISQRPHQIPRPSKPFPGYFGRREGRRCVCRGEGGSLSFFVRTSAGCGSETGLRSASSDLAVASRGPVPGRGQFLWVGSIILRSLRAAVGEVFRLRAT